MRPAAEFWKRRLNEIHDKITLLTGDIKYRDAYIKIKLKFWIINNPFAALINTSTIGVADKIKDGLCTYMSLQFI